MHKTVSCMALACLLAAAPAQAFKIDSERGDTPDAETERNADVAPDRDAAIESDTLVSGREDATVGDLPQTADEDQDQAASSAKAVAKQHGLAPQAEKKQVRQLYCTSERKVGSRLRKKRCRTQAQIERGSQLNNARLDSSRQRFERVQPRYNPPDVD